MTVSILTIDITRKDTFTAANNGEVVMISGLASGSYYTMPWVEIS